MKRHIAFMLGLLAVVVCTSAARAAVSEATADAFGALVIQHGGRLKPIDTFAHHQLLTFSHRSKLQGRSANVWLAEALIDPEAAAEEPLFRIMNDEVVIALGLEPSEDHHYSYNTLDTAIKTAQTEETLRALHNMAREERSLVQSQMVEVHYKTIAFQELSRAFTAILPTVAVNDPELAAAFDLELRLTVVVDDPELAAAFNLELGQTVVVVDDPELAGAFDLTPGQTVEVVDPELAAAFDLEPGQTVLVVDSELAAAFDLELGQTVNYLYFVLRREAMRDLIAELQAHEGDFTPKLEALQALIIDLSLLFSDHAPTALPIFASGTDEAWASPWTALAGGQLTDRVLGQLAALEELMAALQADDADAVEAAVTVFQGYAPDDANVGLELAYNRAKLFKRSLYFYIGAFLLLLTSLIFAPVWGRRLGVACVSLGVVLHLTGLVMRMFIMGRPPVSTLYESVVFVGFIAALFGLLIEFMRRDRLGLLIACSLGAVFHFVGFRYASEGDTLGMLVAVLDSNFWLATHVVTIVIGYGAALVASLVGHVLLLHLAIRPAKIDKTAAILRLARGTACVALFFTLLGTILGGIWADQSWGRFWGWDPKENGALLIVLWLLFVLHAHIAKRVGPAGYAACLSLTSITVILAWFGVNLLSVGLHTYGFTENILINLSVFCGAEVLLVCVCYGLARVRLLLSG